MHGCVNVLRRFPLSLPFKIEQRLKKENIPAHLHNEDYIKRAKNLDTEVVIEKRRHKIFMNGIKLFEIENNEYKICLPKLMETE